MARSLSLLQLNPCFHCFHPIVVRICLKRLSSASPVGFERFPAQRLWQSDSISQVSQRRRARGHSEASEAAVNFKYAFSSSEESRQSHHQNENNGSQCRLICKRAFSGFKSIVNAITTHNLKLANRAVIWFVCILEFPIACVFEPQQVDKVTVTGVFA